MNYSDVSPKFLIGQEVFIMCKNIVVKTNVLGIKINPFPNPEINTIKYYFSVQFKKSLWVDEDNVFENIEELLNSIKTHISIETLTYDELCRHNADAVKHRLRSEIS